jgi:hypothetical protein
MQNNNEIQTHSKNEITIVKKESPLIYYSDLKPSDIVDSTIINNEQKEVLLASLNNPKISTLDITIGNDYYYALAKIIGKAIYDMGITEKSMSQAEQELFIPVAIEEIKNEFKSLTIEDIRIAFHKGSRRKYGTIINGELNPTLQMSILTINIWLTQYTQETKASAIQKLPYLKPKEEIKELSDEEKLKNHNTWLQHVYTKFDDLKKTDYYDYYDFGNTLYNFLKNLNLINLTEEQQQKIWDMAVKELKNEKDPRNAKSFGQRIDLKKIYNKLKLDEVDKEYRELIVIRAKKITVRSYFQKLIKESKHIRDVIENAQKSIKKQNKNK